MKKVNNTLRKLIELLIFLKEKEFIFNKQIK